MFMSFYLQTSAEEPYTSFTHPRRRHQPITSTVRANSQDRCALLHDSLPAHHSI